MARFTKEELTSALTRLGELAESEGERVHLFAVGGAVMMLRYAARDATKDLDVVICAPEPASGVRRLARRVAAEQGLDEDWLNDGAKGYVGTHVEGDILFETPGIILTGAPPAQMVAMKLGAWRDEVDQTDAIVCMNALTGTKERVWSSIEPYLSPGTHTKAWYAFETLWELVHGEG